MGSKMPRKGEVSKVKGITFPKESYTKEEIEALLSACSYSLTGKRNKALIYVMWQSGLRVSEVLALDPRDIDFTHKKINVRHGKGNKQRTVVAGGEALDAIRLWMAAKEEVDLPRNPLFCTKAGESMHSNYIRDMLSRLAKKARWEKRIHPHGFRHTFALNLASQVPMHIVQKQLGHDNLATTSTYLSSIDTSEVEEAMKDVVW